MLKDFTGDLGLVSRRQRAHTQEGDAKAVEWVMSRLDLVTKLISHALGTRKIGIWPAAQKTVYLVALRTTVRRQLRQSGNEMTAPAQAALRLTAWAIIALAFLLLLVSMGFCMVGDIMKLPRGRLFPQRGLKRHVESNLSAISFCIPRCLEPAIFCYNWCSVLGEGSSGRKVDILRNRRWPSPRIAFVSLPSRRQIPGSRIL